MALVMASTAGFCGSSQAVLEGSLQLSGSSRLSMAKTNRIAFTRPGLRVRAQQQSSAETETSRRAMLGLLAAGMASGSFVQTALAESKTTLVATPTALSGRQKTIRIAGIPGLLSPTSDSQGLIRAAKTIAQSIDGLVVDHIDVTKLPFINTDLVVDGRFPAEVEAFMQQVLPADGILFSAPEYNYSVTPITKNAVDWLSLEPKTTAGKTAAIISTGWDFGGGRMQYHLRQIGIRPDLHFINTPEVFVKTTFDPSDPNSPFDANGDLTDAKVMEEFKQLLISLRDFTLQLQCTKPIARAKSILT